MFNGVFTAVVTPFKDGRFDEQSFRNIIERQIQNDIDGIVVCGTTGEAPTLSEQEFERVVKTCVEQVGGRIPVIAGAGSNCTEKAIKLSEIAYRAAVTATLQVTPYYNKPTQDGLYLHFKTIASKVNLPLLLYNVPSRTGVNLSTETIYRLSQISNIVGIKEASGNLEQIKAVIRNTDKNFCLLSGDDALNLEIYKLGGDGTISVTSNILPSKVKRVWTLSHTSIEDAARIQEELIPINKALFLETNPIPVKTALSTMGLCTEEFRLPLTTMQPENKKQLLDTLKQYNVL